MPDPNIDPGSTRAQALVRITVGYDPGTGEPIYEFRTGRVSVLPDDTLEDVIEEIEALVASWNAQYGDTDGFDQGEALLYTLEFS